MVVLGRIHLPYININPMIPKIIPNVLFFVDELNVLTIAGHY